MLWTTPFLTKISNPLQLLPLNLCIATCSNTRNLCRGTVLTSPPFHATDTFTLLENFPPRMREKSKVIPKPTLLLEKCDKDAYKTNNYLSLLNYNRLCQALQRKHMFWRFVWNYIYIAGHWYVNSLLYQCSFFHKRYMKMEWFL